MRMKIVWLVASCWMVTALVLASCAPAVPEGQESPATPTPKQEETTPKQEVVPKEVVAPEAGAEMVKWTGKKLDGTTVELMKEKPQYGGVFIDFADVEPASFEESIAGTLGNDPVNEQLVFHDWTRGLSGTGEWGAVAGPSPEAISKLSAGGLAESWELADSDTIVFHIRKGVHFAYDQDSEASRLVAGRELTADDIVFSERRAWSTPTAFVYRAHGRNELLDHKNLEDSIYVSPDDPWTVVLKAYPGNVSLPWEMAIGTWTAVLAPEVIEKYGSMTTENWRNVVGTGPFMLKDYVGASSLTFARNPNYWAHDPFFPENQLPYVDMYKVLIIPDISTRMAAMRTGKIDRVYGVSWEDAQSLIQTNPDLPWIEFVEANPFVINMNNDAKPFDDIRVRQALLLAINNQELADVFYGGKADILPYPIPQSPQFSDIYTALEEMPASVKELYEYHPDKAKQLLAAAGYPNGFETSVITRIRDVDLLSIIKDYWSKIGVDLKIDVRESGVMTALANTYEQLYMTTTPQHSLAHRFNIEADINPMTNDNVHSSIAVGMRRTINTENYFLAGYKQKLLTSPLSEALPEIPEAQGLQENWSAYANEQVWRIFLPEPYNFLFWQPWVKGYDGTYSAGHHDNRAAVARFLWIDQKLKKSMGH